MVFVLRGALAMLASAVALTALAPERAHAQQAHDVGQLRLGGYFVLGLGGDLDRTIEDASISDGLDPTIGFGLRGEAAVHEFFAVGGAFEVLTFQADTEFWDDEREAVFDLGAWGKVRYAFDVARDLVLEPYLGVPFGLTLAVLNSIDGDGETVWPGFHTGILAGAMLTLAEQLGFFLELGWRHHQIFHSYEVFGRDVGLKAVTNQFAMHFGAMVIF